MPRESPMQWTVLRLSLIWLQPAILLQTSNLEKSSTSAVIGSNICVAFGFPFVTDQFPPVFSWRVSLIDSMPGQGPDQVLVVFNIYQLVHRAFLCHDETVSAGSCCLSGNLNCGVCHLVPAHFFSHINTNAWTTHQICFAAISSAQTVGYFFV